MTPDEDENTWLFHANVFKSMKFFLNWTQEGMRYDLALLEVQLKGEAIAKIDDAEVSGKLTQVSEKWRNFVPLHQDMSEAAYCSVWVQGGAV